MTEAFKFKMYGEDEILNMGKDDIKLEFYSVLKHAIKIIPREVIAQALDTTGGTICRWCREDVTKWAGAETSRKNLPNLLLLLEKHSKPEENPPTQQPVHLSVVENIAKNEDNAMTNVEQALAKTTNTAVPRPTIHKNIHRPPQVPLQLHLIKPEQKTIHTLKQLFSERIGKLDDHSEIRLEEYFMYLSNARDNDWWDWAFQGIVQVATKTQVTQRSIGYLFGVYKSWLNYGFGTFFSSETHKLIDAFVKKFNVKPSEQALRKIQGMISEYGIVHATIAIMHTEPPKDIDISLVLANKALAYCEQQNFTKSREDCQQKQQEKPPLSLFSREQGGFSLLLYNIYKYHHHKT